jgi:hypothetical protein
MAPQVFQDKRTLYKALRHGTDHHRAGLCETFKAGRNIGCFPQSQLFMPASTAHFSHYDRAGVDAKPHGKLDAVLGLQVAIQCPHGIDNSQSCAHGTVRIVFVGSGVAKVNEKPITEILRYVALKVLNDLRRRFLVGAHDLSEVLGIELAGQVGRSNQIAKHHGQLTPFRVWGAGLSRSGCRLSVVRGRCRQGLRGL